MEKSSKRGKIPQSDWPLIMARYEAGETLASIARTYDCSPPAISYVVSRSRTRQPGMALPPPAEPQLVKAPAAETSIGVAKSQPIAAKSDPAPSIALPPAATLPRTETPAIVQVQRDEQPAWPQPAASAPVEQNDDMRPRETNGFVGSGVGGRDAHPLAMPLRPASLGPQQPNGSEMPPGSGNGNGNGDPRRTLHLSLGTPPHGNGSAQPQEAQPAERANFANNGHQPQPQTAPERFVAPAPSSHYAPERQGNGAGGQRKDGGSFIDKELRARVDGDIAAFLAAFDAALVQDTQESRSSLREATDRLLRAGARTRIELERLEARVPLPPRDGVGRSEPAWRHR
jgi:hypothetical protein